MARTVWRALGVLVLGLAAAAPAGAAAASWQAARDAGREAYLRFDYPEAEERLREAVLTGHGEGQTADLLVELADVLWVLGRDQEAERTYRRALERQERALGRDHPGSNRTRWALFAVCTVRGEFREAASFFARVVPEPEAPALVSVVVTVPDDLARARVLSGFPLKYAEAIHRRALRLHESTHGLSATAGPAQELAKVLRALNRADALSALEERLSNRVRHGAVAVEAR